MSSLQNLRQVHKRLIGKCQGPLHFLHGRLYANGKWTYWNPLAFEDKSIKTST